MILQRIGIIVGFEPGTSAPEVLYAANERSVNSCVIVLRQKVIFLWA